MSGKILVIEDDENLRVILVEALLDFDYDVVGAGSVDEGMELAGAQLFDLVVSDVRMEGRDGIEGLMALKHLRPNLRCIIITGYADADAPGRAILAEAEDYLYKPFTIRELVSSVQRVMRSDEEQAGYQKLLSAMASSYRRLFEKAAVGAATMRVERLRGKAFTGFFVAVRSKILSQRDAYQAWSLLEHLEVCLTRLKQNRSDPDQLTLLAKEYRYLVDLLGAVREPDRLAIKSPTSASLTSPEKFAKLHRLILDGEISVEQLKLAPYLHHLQAERPVPREIVDLQELLWGDELRSG